MTFAEFEVDADAGILRRNGDRVRLQDLPFRVLVVLVRRAGAVVSRDELRAELWGAETFVDAEAGLNTAIAKLRDALGDDAESPRFVETVPKRGYRFIGTLARQRDAETEDDAPAKALAAARLLRRTLLVTLGGLVAFVIAAVAYQYLVPTRVTIAVVRFHNETGDIAHDRLAESLTDAVVVSLAGNARYGVIGNSPLLQTERIFEDVGKIGAALRADYVVLGQLQLNGTGLVARAHFIRVSDQKHLWADTFALEGTSAERAVTSGVANGVASGLTR